MPIKARSQISLMLEVSLFSEELVAVGAVSSKQSLVIRSQAASTRGVGHWGTQSESEEHYLNVFVYLVENYTISTIVMKPPQKLHS